MSGKSPSQAVEAFLAPLQRAVSCVSRIPLLVGPDGRRILGKPHTLLWNGGKPVSLKTKNSRIGLELAMRYEIVHVPDDPERSPYKVRTSGYLYSIQSADGAEVLSYHWHPFGNSAVSWPHLHIGAVALAPEGLITKKAHLPTARISLEQVLGVCIAELGAIALRDDWQQVLADSEDLFKLRRTWH